MHATVQSKLSNNMVGINRRQQPSVTYAWQPSMKLIQSINQSIIQSIDQFI